MEPIKVLDHGFVRFVEAWGHGDAGIKNDVTLDTERHFITEDYECGIIEAARQSTQASFRGWDNKICSECSGAPKIYEHEKGKPCPGCWGLGRTSGDQRLLAFLFCNKPPHATPFEFAGMVIEVRAPIFIFREWHRHRTQSYNEMSARYAPLPDLNYVPTVERCLMNSTKNKQAGTIKGADELNASDATEFRSKLTEMYVRQEAFYQKWLQKGVPKEIVRIDLPVGRYSQMRAQANLRNWLAFLTLRSDPGAMWEIQQYTNAVGMIIAEKFPRTWALYQLGKV